VGIINKTKLLLFSCGEVLGGAGGSRKSEMGVPV
jgi:hypothetical protein